MIAELSSKPFRFPSLEPAKEESVPVGNRTIEFFCDFSWLATLLKADVIVVPEMSDTELAALAAQSGTFSFWDDPKEDCYNALLNE